METTLKWERVILTKELNEKFNKIGECYEVCNVFDDSFMLRDATTKVAVGLVKFSDFDEHFVHEENYKGWTSWIPFAGFDGQADCFYKTNRRDVEIKFVTDKVRAKSYLHNSDDFNLAFGLNLAYLRCRNKALEKKKSEYEEELKKISKEIADNNRTIEKMISSLQS